MDKNSKVLPATIYIPDMSGFTKFVNTAGLDYIVKVIPELLRNMINSNVLGMKVAEIQGDAILFYKTGDPPSLEEICNQTKKIFVDFDYKLKLLEKEWEHAHPFLDPAENLGLKIIVHQGTISLTEIGGILKLFGKDVIIAHRLLKNKIPMDDYLLLSQDYLDTQGEKMPEKIMTWSKIEEGTEDYDNIGRVDYKYISLKPLERLNLT